MSDKKVLIEVKDLCKSFGNVNVLNGISTEIAQGRGSSHHRTIRLW